jgi:hypothetical protein
LLFLKLTGKYVGSTPILPLCELSTIRFFFLKKYSRWMDIVGYGDIAFF